TPTPTSVATTTPTAEPTATPCSNCSAVLPAKVITGYWQDFCNGADVLQLAEVPAAYNLIAVAFATSTSTPGAVTFSLDPCLGYSGTSQFITDINTVHSSGRSVILSVGGANGTI